MSNNASENVKPGMVVGERYRVVRQLGRGGMGSVFLVQHVHTDEQLALKILHSAVISDAVALERFRREARTPARINSDHVVRVTDADIATNLGGLPFLVMEYLRGEDLDKRVERVGPLQPAEVVLYLRQAARALDKAHALGIIHRDLKPENLFLTQREDGTPCIKILDFGIAKLTGEASREMMRAAATTTGQIFGTPLYMSPEQAKGESNKISPQTDVWALGLIAHRLLTGRDIWTAETITHLIAQIAYEPMPIPSEHGSPFGHEYDRWFALCCNRNVKDRYASAGEAISSLALSLGISEVFTLPGSGPDRITGKFIVDVPTPNPAIAGPAAVTLSTSQLNLLGEPPPTLPAPPPVETQPMKSSAGPLTLTGLKLGTAPRKSARMRALAAIGVIAAFGAVAFLWWSTRPVVRVTDDARVTNQQGASSIPTTAPTPVTTPAVTTPTSKPMIPAVVPDAGAPEAGVPPTNPKTPHTAGANHGTSKVPVITQKKPFDPLAGRH
ncbi:serine/threonine protein kinase [Polyangium aurulentum]|uniref:serine/threonine protein kinase n=1 Tax=Polyangium aurulentum TaxID=2567896 RepID=UPI0010ADEF8C|nr:serine/threonine-protein kinase [Polyangium aurulentum]UQA54783.1 serine/threonine protein kinase [Polyangium aurulentum]